MRKYTVQDIDALRYVVTQIYLYGSLGAAAKGGSSRSYREDDMTKVVEEQVRTYMLAGITAQDLYDAEKPKKSRAAAKAFVRKIA